MISLGAVSLISVTSLWVSSVISLNDLAISL
jgi:hypothetical protein